GQLVAAEIVLATVLSSLAKLGKQLEAFYDLMAATDKLGMVLDVPLERSNGEHHFTVEAHGAELEMRGVSWSTPGGGPLFSNVTFTANRGERIGIRGPSGAGKSVLLELAWGLRAPTAGNIRVDGRDLRELTLESLRRSVALVDGIDVIDATVRENVLMARPFVSDDKVREALQRVDLLDPVSSLPDGLETRLGVDGAPLSLGQLAELQLARAIAAEPRLLLVSDVFPILDSTERGRLFDVLFDRDAPWTLVFITNSEDALSRCDRTFVFEHGSLVPDQSATAAS
ncbi:MAG: ABC transporter ATP-binding protein, partial [Planctomycetota bacterium]